MAKATINLFGKSYKVRICTSTYRNSNAIAVFAVEEDTDEQFCTLSVNLPESKWLKEGEWYGKHWSENEGILQQLMMQKVIEEVPCIPAESGFVQNIRAFRLVES